MEFEMDDGFVEQLVQITKMITSKTNCWLVAESMIENNLLIDIEKKTMVFKDVVFEFFSTVDVETQT